MSLELLDCDDEWELGEDLSRVSEELLSLLFAWALADFSILDISLAFGASEPIALQVCASKARGLFLVSS